MSDNVFLDSNVLIYALSKDTPAKRKIARNLLKKKYFISVQVLFEFINVSVKKLGNSKAEAVEDAQALLENCELVSEDKATVEMAFVILKKYKLQIFDSKIIAAAILSDCKILYSEDFQHGQTFDGNLKVVNPFR